MLFSYTAANDHKPPAQQLMFNPRTIMMQICQFCHVRVRVWDFWGGGEDGECRHFILKFSLYVNKANQTNVRTYERTALAADSQAAAITLLCTNRPISHWCGAILAKPLAERVIKCNTFVQQHGHHAQQSPESFLIKRYWKSINLSSFNRWKGTDEIIWSCDHADVVMYTKHT